MRYKSERQLQKKLLLKDGDYRSTKEVLERIVKYIPDKNILAELDAQKNIVYHTAKDIYNDVESLGAGLLDMGLHGKHIAIIADNSYRYLISDMAISGGVGVVTPIDKDAPNDLMVTLLNKCDADAVIISAHLLNKIESIKDLCPKLSTIITIDKKVEGYPSLDEVLAVGRNLELRQVYRNTPLDLDAPAKILFTSGTTGANKAVVFSQNNLAANILNAMDTIKADEKGINTSMSVLPMHHSTEINTHILPRIACGRLTYINDSIKNMMTNIKIFKPSVITIVPMIANAFYKNIWMNATKLGKADKLKKGIKLSNFLRKFGIDITHKLFKDVFEPFGGNLNQIVSGGAMLSPEVVKGFNDLGVFIVNGYGITECGPLISMNSDTLEEAYSVGCISPNLEAKLVNIDLNDVGELCVRGKSVTRGYYMDPEATATVLDNDGFFNTGDLARIDDKGRIFIVGRKKNVIVLDNGKNVCPEEIEHEIQINLDYCKELVVYMGDYCVDGKTHPAICLNIYIEDSAIREDKARILNDIRNVNKKLSNYKRVNYVNISDKEFEKTSTNKIKRCSILEYHDSVNGIRI